MGDGEAVPNPWLAWAKKLAQSSLGGSAADKLSKVISALLCGASCRLFKVATHTSKMLAEPEFCGLFKYPPDCCSGLAKV